jgi:hypothetical protein
MVPVFLKCIVAQYIPLSGGNHIQSSGKKQGKAKDTEKKRFLCENS